MYYILSKFKFKVFIFSSYEVCDSLFNQDLHLIFK